MNIQDEENRRQEIEKIIRLYFLQHPEQFLFSKREIDNYTLKDKFEKGIITLNDVDWLISNNAKRAANFGLHLSWNLRNGAVYGKIREGDSQLYEIAYDKGYVHQRIVQMQFDFDHTLNQLENFGKEIEKGL